MSKCLKRIIIMLNLKNLYSNFLRNLPIIYPMASTISDTISLKVQKFVRKMELTIPSIGFLLPSALFWNDDETLVSSFSKNYTFAEMQYFLR